MTAKEKKELARSPKGMHDILPADIAYYNAIVARARDIADYFGFLEIKTPHVEHVELFLRPLGETSDVVQKEMYTFRTKGGDMLALRPEGTAPMMRSYVEHGMASWPQPVKLFYEGAFFRHESPQRGRFREFYQFGFEILGDTDAISDATIIKMCYLLLSELGFKDVAVHINSIGDRECRPVHRRELTAYYRKKFNYLCKDCKWRLKENPLRLLDCKQESCVELRAQAPQMLEYLCDDCKTHFKGVLEFLDEADIPYILDHYLVRGFDYYGRTVFEMFVAELARNISSHAADQNASIAAPVSVAGGGRYDNLMALLGQRPLPAVGSGIGIDRLMIEMKRVGMEPKTPPSAKVFLIQIGLMAKKRSFVLMDELRKAGIRANASLSRDNLKTQLNIAAKVGASFALIIGQKEAMENTVIVRDMNEGIQETIAESRLIEKLKMKLKTKKQ